ncbi:putative reverse transcriptase domain-containing protein [Tanacetum coccineum]
MERKEDESLYFMDRIWVPLVGGVRTIIMDEAHKTRYSVHPRADKMYHDLRDMHWWSGMKRNIATYVSKCLTCLKVKAEHQRPSGLLQQPEIPEWKWDNITMDFITKLPRSKSGHDTIWVVVDRLTKSAYFLATREDYSIEKLARLYIDEIVTRHGVLVSIISDRDGRASHNRMTQDLLTVDAQAQEKGIRREYSVARTPQQNGAEAVRTACLCKFDGKSDEGFFVGYSLSSKAFRVYNTRTRRVEENLHIGFLENKPMIEGNGPKWLFDIDSLTQSMNYVPIAAGTITNESARTQGELNTGTSTQKEEISPDCIVEDGPDNENDEKYKYEDDISHKEVNTAGQNVNTVTLEVNTGRFKLNTVDPPVNTASSYDQDSPKDMFTMGASHTLEATHVEFFSDKDESEVDLRNITNSYTVPLTPNTRIHKDHPITNVIGDVKSTIQTRRMTQSISKQGFLSAIEPTSIAKALSDSSWVEEMQEELLQFKL